MIEKLDDDRVLIDLHGGEVRRNLDPLMWTFLDHGEWVPSRLADWADLTELKSQFSYTLLTERAARRIGEFRELIELGPGTGYNAAKIERLTGANILAFDLCPVGQNAAEENPWHALGKSYFSVKKGTEQVLPQYPERTLVIMSPPDSLGYEALKLYTGQDFVYVGEPEYLEPGKLIRIKRDGLVYSVVGTRGRSGSPAFHALLKKEWEPVERIDLPNFPDLHASLVIYRRKVA